MVLEYFAHTTDYDESTWQPLKEHLTNVALLTSRLCKKFGAEEMGFTIGVMHDIGKYSNEFQNRLRGDPGRVDHSTAGAQLAWKKYGGLGSLMAFCIAGHHAGLTNWIVKGHANGLKERLNNAIPNYEAYRNFVDIPKKLPQPKFNSSFEVSVFVRMLFSCLVDADRIDTETFAAKSHFSYDMNEITAWPTIQELKANFDAYMQGMQKKPGTKINNIRSEILQAAVKSGQEDRGVFTLTVPTGGGKTLSSLAFALEHATRYNFDRIIYVVPYMSVTHQNADVFRAAVGNDAVLEHHSSFKMPDGIDYRGMKKIKYAEGNWNASLVVTTAVQFFDSLFSNRPSKCRKIHNIANSIVILDEAQNIPLHLLRPCVAMLNSLVRNYGTTIVLCTATQPALLKADDFHGGFENVREISPDRERIYNEMKRTSIVPLGEMDDESIARKMSGDKNALCIVNTRKHAWRMYQRIKQDGNPNVFCLTALMCPEHRRQKIDEIKKRLDGKISCTVISTNLIEAGVDIDFDVVYREITGLDSIAQAAGRCNREGSNESGNVYVFESPGTYQPPGIQRAMAVCKEMIEEFSNDLLSIGTIRRYFKEIYWLEDMEGLDREKIMDAIRIKNGMYELAFYDIAKKFRMIDDSQESVIIPFDGDARAYIDRLSKSDFPENAGRRLQPYVIQVREEEFKALRDGHRIKPIVEEKFGDQFWVLEDTDLYDESTGLSAVFDL